MASEGAQSGPQADGVPNSGASMHGPESAGRGGSRRGGPRRILFAAEDLRLRDAANVYFSARGDEIEATGTPTRALMRLQSSDTPVDVVVAAVDSRSDESFSVLAALRSRENAPPTIAVTLPQDNVAIDRALDLGADSFLSAPLNWRLLEHQIAFAGRVRARMPEAEFEPHSLLAKSQVVAAMRHDFRTPLNGVLGYAEMIEMRARELGDAALTKFSGHILTAGRRLTATLDDLLLYAEMTTGEARFEPMPMSANALIRLAIERLEDSQRALDVCQIHAHDLTLKVDPYYFTAGLAHLIMNALQFGAPPVHIVATPVLTESMSGPVLKGATIAVLDQGRNPALPEISAKAGTDPLLTPSRAHANHAGAGGRDHMGLGLAMARASAQLHGGTLRVGENHWGGCSAAMVLPVGAVESRDIRALAAN